jgi:hypothetical protein
LKNGGWMPFQVRLGLPDDVARHELRRVLVHVDEAVQLAQDVVGQVLRGLGLAVQVDRHVGVLAPHQLDEGAQVQHRRVQVRARRELLVVDRQDEGAGAALLLRELRQVAVAGDAQHLEALGLDGLRERADAQSRGVLGPVVFVDDDDGETEFHGGGPGGVRGGEPRSVCNQRRPLPHSRIAHNAGQNTRRPGWRIRRCGGCWPARPWRSNW